MGMRYKPYSDYKAADGDWLGSVPAEWKCIALGRLFWRVKRTNHGDKELLSVYRDYGVIPKASRDDNFNKPSDDLSPYQLVCSGDLVMNKMKAWQGSIAISAFEGIVSPAYFVYQPVLNFSGTTIPKYIHYLLRSPLYVAQYLRRSKGIRVNQWDLDPEGFERIEVLLPSQDEQQKIADFLNYETARIDTLIEKQQQLIELLIEKRQAVISHAVTKGLNPDAPMRDSGVAWLGKVPAHWDVLQLRRITHLQQGLQIPQEQRFAEPDEKRVEYITVKSINAGDAGEHKEYIDSPSARVVCNEEEVLLARTGATGQVFTNLAGAFHNNFFKVNYDAKRVSRNYLVYFLSVSEVKSHLLMLAGTTTIPDLNHGAFLETKACLPSIEEQYKISAYLDRALERYSYISEQAKSFVSLLQERRTALISAAVTGKIDVRDWQPPKSLRKEAA